VSLLPSLSFPSLLRPGDLIAEYLPLPLLLELNSNINSSSNLSNLLLLDFLRQLLLLLASTLPSLQERAHTADLKSEEKEMWVGTTGGGEM